MYFFTFKFVNTRLIINYTIHCNRSYVGKQSVLNLIRMSDDINRDETAARRKIPLQNAYLTPTVQLLVVGSGAAGVPSNVLLINSNTRYLINCGEGTQKLGSEYRMNLEKTSHVFVTHTSWKNVSGLIGLFLLVQQSGKKELFLHGLSRFKTIFPTLNKYIKLRHLQLRYESSQHYEEFSDGVTSVKYVHIYPSLSMNHADFSAYKLDKEKILDIESEIEKKTERDFVTLNKNQCSPELSKKSKHKENILNMHYQMDDGNNTGNCMETLHVNKALDKCAISYIFQTMPTSGALLFEKCLEYGVPSGPLLGELKMGNDVTLKNGKVVRSVDVKNPDLPGVDIIVVDCPSENYLDSLLREQAFHEYQFGGKIAEAVVHFSNSQIVKNFKYEEWINNFPKGTKHLFINEDNNLSGSVGIPRQQFKLNYLHSDIFPLLYDAKIPDFPRAKNSATENGHVIISSENNPSAPIYSDRIFYKCENNNYIYGETMCNLYIKPKFGYDYSKCLVLKKNEFLNEMFKNNAKEKIEKWKENLRDLELSLKSDNKIYPKIVFLGTGSSRPSKVRNASGILIFLDENRCILLDCGENVYNQLIIFYGKQKASEILKKIHAIYISHLHLDHHLGLITILKERKLAFDEQNKSSIKNSTEQTTSQEVYQEFKPVFLLAPEQILKYLETFSAEFNDILNLFDLLPNSLLVKGNEFNQKAELCKKKLKLHGIRTTSVWHCTNSFGISIIHETGWKITYSGDTRPCEALVKLGMNSDVLIHEATFDDSFDKEARIKLHSTTNQAIEIGKSMKAKYIILTHFSQRYCYLPVIEKKFNNSNIGIAFDFMEVSYNKLSLLPKLLEPVQNVFSEYSEKNQLDSQSSFLKRKMDEEDTSNLQRSDDGPTCITNESSAKISKKSVARAHFKLSAFDKA